MDALELHKELRRLHRHLQIAHAGIVVATAALRHQNAERDEEIARVLEHCVGARVFRQIERATELMDGVSRRPPGEGDRDLGAPLRPGR